MSFDIHLAPVPGVAFDVAAVHRVLDRHSARSGGGAIAIATGDGGADLYGSVDPDKWLTLNHAEGHDIWAVIHEMAAVAPYCVMPIGCETFVSSLDHVALVPQEAPGPVVAVSSGDEMRKVVAGEPALPLVDVAGARAALERFAARWRLDLESLDVSGALALMTSWYALQRIGDAAVDEDGDMLLVQWGVYDWGEGPSFEYDITRQLVSRHEEDDDAIWQLGLTLHHRPSPSSAPVRRGNRWCGAPRGLAEFQRFALTAAATRAVAASTPERVALRFEVAG